MNLNKIIEDSELLMLYDTPNNSTWIIGVDFKHNTFIITPPNIHPSFLDFENADETSLPYTLTDHEPGVYEIVCNFKTETDRETGIVDDYAFTIKTITPLIII